MLNGIYKFVTTFMWCSLGILIGKVIELKWILKVSNFTELIQPYLVYWITVMVVCLVLRVILKKIMKK